MSKEWDSWTKLDENTRRTWLHADGFWDGLSEQQRQAFLEEADWQELRLVPEAKQAKLDALVSLDAICQQLGLNDVQVYFLMSTRKLPAWLVGGEWKYSSSQVDRWVDQMGGKDAVQADVEDQIAKHRAGRGEDA